MEFLTELAKEAISKLGELAVESTVKQIEYMTHYKKIIAELKEEHDKLEGVKEALQGWVDTKRMNREGIEPNIQNWLNDVAAFENVLKSFYEDKVKMNKKCFGGKCPNLTYNYSLGKQASKSIEYITRLKEEKNEFQLISYHKAPPTLGSSFTEDIKSLESRKKIITEIIDKLKDDAFKRISICGMGGVGKTTLVKELIKSVENELFDKVVMAVISQNPDYKNIQSQIADCLGLSLKSESVEGRGRELMQRLKEIDDDGKTKVLIVLDDVWSELNFDWVGIPSRDNQKCIKIVFTSRIEKECQKMGSQVNFHVSILLKEEAWYLFQSMTGDVVYEPHIYPIAKQVAKECGGLPLAIVIVGKALENEKELTTWEDGFEQLQNSQSSSFPDVHNYVYSRIELSFKILGSTEHKKLLMLCGLFPEDFDIPIEILLRHAIGLGLFKAVGEPLKARNRVRSLVGDLKRCFMLLDSNVPGCVKMHDIVRDVVILVSFKTEHKFMVKYDMKRLKEEKLNDINAISLILDHTIELENSLDCPTLQLLQVRSKGDGPNQWPEHFFRGMRALRVLSMHNLHIQKLSSFSQALVSLHTLQVEYCDVGDISIIGKELTHIEVLSFAHSNIKELPIEIGNLSILRLLDLTNCNDLNVISSNVLIRLSRLEELYLRMDNFPWKGNEVAINELKKISYQLKVFEIKVRGTEVLIKDLDLYNLQKFWIYVDIYSDFQRSAHFESNLLQISAIDYQSINSILMISQLIKKCEILAIRKVKDLKNVMRQLSHDCPIPYLKDLRVDSCPDLEYLIDCTTHCSGFPQIRSLSLKNLQNFKEMCYTPNYHEIKGLMIDFSYLVELKLKDLPLFIGFDKAKNLKELNQVKRMNCAQSEATRVDEGVLSMNDKLFSSEWMQQFPKLETIFLEKCSSINVVFDTQRYSYSDGQVFPQLKEMEIFDLNQLTHVWSKALHYVQGFQNLKSLTISSCDSLRHVFTPAIIREVTNLEKLEIKSCKLMEYLVTDEEDGEEGGQINKEEVNIISFEKLDSLKLSRLPNLARVSANSCEIEFPSLRKLVIDDCPKLDTLFLLSAYTKHNNHYVASYSNLDGTGVSDFDENYPRSSNFHFGCMPLCYKLIRQSNKNNKIKGRSVSERKPRVELGGASLLEELFITGDLHDKLFLKGMDQARIRGGPVIDGHLFPYLKSLIMGNSDKITVLLSFSSMRCFEQLEKLHIFECNNLNEMVSQEESESSGEKIIFPALKSLILTNLPKLMAFFQSPYNLDCPSLQSVEISGCPNMDVFSHGFCSTPKLEDCNIRIGSLGSSYIHKNDMNATIQGFKTFVALQSSEMLNWTELYGQGMFGYFGKEREISIREYHRLSMLVPSNEIQMLQHVRTLDLSYCDSLVEVFESIGESTRKRDVTTHYQLQEMTLSSLPRLNQIWKHNIAEFVSFQNLTVMSVFQCDSLRSLFSHSMARSLVQLQKIVVEKCKMMEEIITMEEEYIGGGNKIKTLFPKLEVLKLCHLPMLECVCSGDYDYDIPLCTIEEDRELNNNDKVQISFPQLKELVFLGVPKIKCFCSGGYNYDIELLSIEEGTNRRTFPYGKVIVNTPSLRTLRWDKDGLSVAVNTLGDLNLTIYYVQNSKKCMVELQKLETFKDMDEELLGYIKRVTHLDIVNCHKLLNCIPSNMMHLLSHLEKLSVNECEYLEEIFESTDSMLQWELVFLKLLSLPKLKHIWKNHCQGFECLQLIIIYECNDLEYVLPDVSVLTSIPNLWLIGVYECQKMKEIIGNNCNPTDCVQQKAKIKFPKLMKIELQKLPSLKCFGQSSFPCYIEMPKCRRIKIEDCPEMKTFWFEGILYTPGLYEISLKNTKFDKYEDVNDVIQRHNK